MELKQLSMADIDRAAALFAEVFTREPWNDDWSDARQLNAYLADLMGQSNSLAFGYFDGGSLIALSLGNIRHWYEGTQYHIDEFCVDSGRQGRGVGGRFLREIERALQEQGVRSVFLLTERSVPAFDFYKKQGFFELTGNAAFAKKLN